MAGRDTRWTLRYGFCQAFLFFEVAGDPNDVLVGTGVALLGDFLVDPRGVATALLPPPQDVVLVGCDGADLLREVTSFGGVLKARYFSTVWRCIPSSLATWAFFMPFFERAWMDRKSLRV